MLFTIQNDFVTGTTVEQCNNQDDDCDGQVDEDCSTDIGGGPVEPKGCGCDSNGTGAAWWLLLLMAMGARRRRA